MLVLCLCRVRQRDFTQLHALCVSMCMPTCTRYVRDMYAAARALHSQGSGHFTLEAAGTFTDDGMVTLSLSRQRGTFSLSRTKCMRQRGHFHSFTLKAARRHLGMSATTVCRTARAFEFVRVCSSLLEFAFEFVLSWAVRVLRNRVNRVSRCASRSVSRCASRCVDFSQPHALTRPRARWRWWRWFFSLFICRWWRVGDELARW